MKTTGKSLGLMAAGLGGGDTARLGVAVNSRVSDRVEGWADEGAMARRTARRHQTKVAGRNLDRGNDLTISCSPVILP
jgi:hypothetical protein